MKQETLTYDCLLIALMLLKSKLLNTHEQQSESKGDCISGMLMSTSKPWLDMDMGLTNILIRQ